MTLLIHIEMVHSAGSRRLRAGADFRADHRLFLPTRARVRAWIHLWPCPSQSLQVTIKVNHPPNGAVLCSPCSGTAVDMVFSLRAVNWTDLEGNLPLAYAFSIANPASVALSSSSTLPSLQVCRPLFHTTVARRESGS